MNQGPNSFGNLPIVRRSPSVPVSTPSTAPAVTEARRHRGWTFLKVSGKSMFPWIRPGDVVFLRRAAIEEIHRGDVVVFERNSALCIHRVLTVRRNVGDPSADSTLLTKGDAVTGADDPVSTDALYGKIEFVYRRNRELSIVAGWRKHFARLLVFASPLTRWWRPAASRLHRAFRRTEVSAAAPAASQSTGHSAD